MSVFSTESYDQLVDEAVTALAKRTAPVSSTAGCRRAQEHCRRITAHHSRTFYFASGLLPAEKRAAMRCLYAFCRTTDDIVDQPGEDPRAQLADWEQRAVAAAPDTSHPVLVAWHDLRCRYGIPTLFARQLVQAARWDLDHRRYAAFDELVRYCYGVASTVGLMSMTIIGYSGPEAVPYAIQQGIALQMTNILRDVVEDWRRGRVYLPQEELAAFGLTEADIAAGEVTQRWRDFMRFEIERNRTLYAEAWPGIAMLHPDGRLAVAAAAGLYAAILDDIEAHDYDVFSRRAHISAVGKLRRLGTIRRNLRHLTIR